MPICISTKNSADKGADIRTSQNMAYTECGVARRHITGICKKKRPKIAIPALSMIMDITTLIMSSANSIKINSVKYNSGATPKEYLMSISPHSTPQAV